MLAIAFVLVLPRLSPLSFDSPIFAGQSVQAACFVSEGDFPLQFSWSFNSRPDLSSLGIGTMNAGRKTNLLIIEPAQYHHRGLYTCSVSNPAGTVSSSAKLEIHGKLACLLASLLSALFIYNFYFLCSTYLSRLLWSST